MVRFWLVQVINIHMGTYNKQTSAFTRSHFVSNLDVFKALIRFLPLLVNQVIYTGRQFDPNV